MRQEVANELYQAERQALEDAWVRLSNGVQENTENPRLSILNICREAGVDRNTLIRRLPDLHARLQSEIVKAKGRKGGGGTSEKLVSIARENERLRREVVELKAQVTLLARKLQVQAVDRERRITQ